MNIKEIQELARNYMKRSIPRYGVSVTKQGKRVSTVKRDRPHGRKKDRIASRTYKLIDGIRRRVL